MSLKYKGVPVELSDPPITDYTTWWNRNPGLVTNHSAGKILKSMNAEWERLQKLESEEN